MPDQSYHYRSRLEPDALAGEAPSIYSATCDREVQASLAISAKRQADALERIADALEPAEGRPQGSILLFLETIAGAAKAGRS